MLIPQQKSDSFIQKNLKKNLISDEISDGFNEEKDVKLEKKDWDLNMKNPLLLNLKQTRERERVELQKARKKKERWRGYIVYIFIFLGKKIENV